MANNIFTLQKIKDFLNELGFEWIDLMIYNPNYKKYKKATMKHFRKRDNFLYLKNNFNGNIVLTLATITNNEFMLSKNSNILDASLEWQKYINKQKETTNEI